MLTQIFKRLWGVYFYLVFSGLLLLLFPFFWVILKSEAHYRYANRLRKVWAYGILFLTGVFPKVEGASSFHRHEPAIICSNHTSTLDIVLFGILLGDRYMFVAKEDFKSIPIFGYFFKTIDIPVDRSTKKGAYKAYLQSKKALDKGYKLVMFPEGTTSANPPNLVSFKNGPFKLAIDQHVPIVPITFMDNWKLFHYDLGFYGKPGLTRTVIHEPIDTRQMTSDDVPLLKERVYSIIESTLKEEYESQFKIS